MRHWWGGYARRQKLKRMLDEWAAEVDQEPLPKMEKVYLRYIAGARAEPPKPKRDT